MRLRLLPPERWHGLSLRCAVILTFIPKFFTGGNPMSPTFLEISARRGRSVAHAMRAAAGLFGIVVALAGLASCDGGWALPAPSGIAPTIVTPPANQTVLEGSTATFNVTAIGTAPLAYQWLKSGVAIAGATANSYTTPPTTVTDSGSLFSVTVSNAYGKVTSITATLTVTAATSPPAITAQPVSTSVCAGAAAKLSVTATGAASYQWSLNGAAIAGATSAAYAISSAASTQAGDYTVAVTNSKGSVMSSVATVVVGSSITSNPVNLTVAATQTATFSVAVTGVGPFTYQWYAAGAAGAVGAAISGATSSTYTTPALTSASNGSQYYVKVTDACAAALTSTPATVTVTTGNVPPTIVTQPVSQTVAIGGTATFTVTAVGSPTLTYQWYQVPAGTTTGVALPGATSTSYTVPATATLQSNDQDAYYVIVSNPYGQAVSLQAKLTVGAGIQIAIANEPVTAYANTGAPASFSVKATSTAPLTYQWYVAPPGSSTFTSISGATAATYTIPSTTLIQSGSVFYVTVSNGTTAAVTSTSAGLFVGPLAGINNLCDPTWSPLGFATLITGPVPNCSFMLTEASGEEYGEIVWPTLISTGNIRLSFTVTISDPSSPPADGFAMVLGDPSLGATPTSVGLPGFGLGADGIPGFVLGFDTFLNAGDPPVPYLGVGRSDTALYEKPWTYVNTNIPALATVGSSIVHAYVVTIVQGQMTVSLDGAQVFSGSVTVPPVAYLYMTASTGLFYEQTVVSDLSATVSEP
jgi:hypothetical protein